MAPELGRENVLQVTREKSEQARHVLPATLGGRALGDGATYREIELRVWEGWQFRLTGLTEEFTVEDWRARRPDAVLLAVIPEGAAPRFVGPKDKVEAGPGARLLSLRPEDAGDQPPPETGTGNPAQDS
jgi:hypothetical protein